MPSEPTTDERLAALLARFPDHDGGASGGGRRRGSTRGDDARRAAGAGRSADDPSGARGDMQRPAEIDDLDDVDGDDLVDDLFDEEEAYGDDDAPGFDDPPGPGGEAGARRGRRSGAGDARSPGLVRTPSALVGATTRPGRWQVAGLVAALLLCTGGVGAWAWWTRADAAPAAAGPPLSAPTRTAAPGFGGRSGTPVAGGVTPGGAGATGGPATGVTGSGAPATPSAGGTVAVHVVGAVRRPGVVRLPGGSRVDDAVRAAGGTSPAADPASVNLARPLVDGEQIVVAARGQARGAAPASPAAGSGGGPAAGTGPGGPRGGGGGAGGVVDLNTADIAALDALPGVGPVLAQRIVDWRTQHGRFTSVDQLGDVQGVGDKTLARLTPHVRV